MRDVLDEDWQALPQSLGLPKENICFLSSNGWDAYSTKAYGFKVLGCNRFAQAPERIPAVPDGEIPNLALLPDQVSR